MSRFKSRIAIYLKLPQMAPEKITYNDLKLETVAKAISNEATAPRWGAQQVPMNDGEKGIMRKRILMAVALALVCVAVAPVFAAVKVTGNGSLSGPHYNLNIIGVPNEKNSNFEGGNGARIFVLRDKPTSFYVYGDDTTTYAILDHDGTDGKVGGGVGDPGITFPYDETADVWKAEIYVRLLGSQDSSIHWKTFYDYDGSAWLQVTEFDLSKDSKFQLKTNQLLINGYQDILWELDPVNNFRILQMRIYLTA